MSKKNSKYRNPLSANPVLTVPLLLLVVALTFFFFKENSTVSVGGPTPVPTKTIKTLDSVNTSTWKTYTHPAKKFSFKYPSDWKLSINSSESTTLTKTAKSSNKTTARIIMSEAEYIDEPSLESTVQNYELKKEYELLYLDNVPATYTKTSHQELLDLGFAGDGPVFSNNEVIIHLYVGGVTTTLQPMMKIELITEDIATDEPLFQGILGTFKFQ